MGLFPNHFFVKTTLRFKNYHLLFVSADKEKRKIQIYFVCSLQITEKNKDNWSFSCLMFLMKRDVSEVFGDPKL